MPLSQKVKKLFPSSSFLRTDFGIDNETYFVIRNDKIRSVLKIYTKKNRKEIENIAQTQNWLAECGLPVPDSQLLSADDKNPIMVLSYMPGRHMLNFANSQLIESARLMAKLHSIKRIGGELQKSVAFDYSYFFKRCSGLKGIHKLQKTYGLISGHYLSGLETAVVHGDFSQSNILFDQGRISGVLDWDHVSIAPRLTDLARASIYFCFNDQDEFFLSRLLVFCKAYNAIQKLTPLEKSNFFAHMKLLIIRIALETYFYTSVVKTVRKTIFKNKSNLSPQRLLLRLQRISNLGELQL
jgi:Ser/Thr protein kinase RdoA (MazF antagonist)